MQLLLIRVPAPRSLLAMSETGNGLALRIAAVFVYTAGGGEGCRTDFLAFYCSESLVTPSSDVDN